MFYLLAALTLLFDGQSATFRVNRTWNYNFFNSVPTFRGNWHRTGSSEVNGPLSYRVKWSFQARKSIFSSPVIDNRGFIYFGSQDGYLYCLDKKGKLKWKFFAGNDIDSTPTVGSNGNVYFGSDNGWFYSLKSNGSLHWKVNTGGPMRSGSLVLDDGTVIFTQYNGYVQAYKQGTRLWSQYLSGGWSNSSPSWDSKNELIFVANNRGYISAFTKAGALKWNYNLQGYHYNGAVQNATMPIDQEGNLYLAANSGLYCLNSTGKLLWSNNKIKATMPPSITRDRHLVIVDMSGILYRLNLSGKIIWQKKISNYGNYSNILVDKSGNMYFGSRDDYFYGVDVTGNKLFSRFLGTDIDSSPAMTSEGCVVFGADNGLLQAICR